MKQLIVLLAMIVLGIAIFNFIAGNGDDSIKTTAGDVFRQEIERQNTYP